MLISVLKNDNMHWKFIFFQAFSILFKGLVVIAAFLSAKGYLKFLVDEHGDGYRFRWQMIVSGIIWIPIGGGAACIFLADIVGKKIIAYFVAILISAIIGFVVAIFKQIKIQKSKN